MKKAYKVPTMRVVTLKHRPSLLSGSGPKGPSANSVMAPGIKNARYNSFDDYDDDE